MKTARVSAHVRVLFDGKVQIIGGNNDGSMEIYDPSFGGFGAYPDSAGDCAAFATPFFGFGRIRHRFYRALGADV